MADIARHTGFCPHCGNTAPQQVVLRHPYESEWYDPEGKKVIEVAPECEAIVCICETCNEVLLYDGIAEGLAGWPPLQYPQSAELADSVPTSVREVYSEASRIKRTAPNAFAVMLRRALEAVCDDRGVDKGALAQRLRKLADRGEVPPLLAEVSDVVRFLGNIGAHASGMSVTPPDTWVLDDFLRAIIEYVYVAPGKLKKYKEKLQKLRESRKVASESGA